jgi:hypothetical protein
VVAQWRCQLELKWLHHPNLKPPVFSGKHGDEWTIWEMKMMAHLIDKGLDACLEPWLDNKLPAKESSPSDDDEKGAAELNKKGDLPIYLNIHQHQPF